MKMPFLKSSFSPLPAADADLTIALAGNPNVGKSSIFNALTGMHQHTGNWPGKTVDLASGSCCHKGVRMRWVDLPGTYSLSADSPEEEAARDYLCFEQHDAVVVVCDATCLERNLHLLLQVLEITPRVVLCLNLMDEALKKGIRIDTNLLSQKLGIPVVRTSARTQMGLTELTEAVQAVSRSSSKKVLLPPVPPRIEPLVQTLEQAIAPLLPDGMRSRWAALQLLCRNEDFIRQLDSILETPLLENPTVAAAFSSSGYNIRYVCLHDQFLGLDHIYKAYRHTDDQLRIQLAILNQFIETYQRSGGISDGKDQLLSHGSSLIHAGCSSCGSVGFGCGSYVLIRDKAEYFSAVAGKDSLVDPGLCHVCICHNAGTVFDSSNCFLNCILRETEILCIIKVCACVNTSLYDQLCSGNQLFISKFLCDDLKAAFLYIHWFYIFQFYLHLIFPPLIVTPIPHTTRST